MRKVKLLRRKRKRREKLRKMHFVPVHLTWLILMKILFLTGRSFTRSMTQMSLLLLDVVPRGPLTNCNSVDLVSSQTMRNSCQERME